MVLVNDAAGVALAGTQSMMIVDDIVHSLAMMPQVASINSTSPKKRAYETLPSPFERELELFDDVEVFCNILLLMLLALPLAPS